MALAVGTKLGRYEVHSRLGAGGMGEVYRAKDLRLGRDVAIKADGSEEEKLLPLHPSDDADEYPTSWSPDAKQFLYDRDAETTRPWVAELPGLKTSPLFTATETRKNAQFSRDGKWMAYTSNENGRWEIYWPVVLDK